MKMPWRAPKSLAVQILNDISNEKQKLTSTRLTSKYSVKGTDTRQTASSACSTLAGDHREHQKLITYLGLEVEGWWKRKEKKDLKWLIWWMFLRFSVKRLNFLVLTIPKKTVNKKMSSSKYLPSDALAIYIHRYLTSKT
jgi:hypothetical protein